MAACKHDVSSYSIIIKSPRFQMICSGRQDYVLHKLLYYIILMYRYDYYLPTTVLPCGRQLAGE